MKEEEGCPSQMYWQHPSYLLLCNKRPWLFVARNINHIHFDNGPEVWAGLIGEGSSLFHLLSKWTGRLGLEPPECPLPHMASPGLGRLKPWGWKSWWSSDLVLCLSVVSPAWWLQGGQTYFMLASESHGVGSERAGRQDEALWHSWPRLWSHKLHCLSWLGLLLQKFGALGSGWKLGQVLVRVLFLVQMCPHVADRKLVSLPFL